MISCLMHSFLVCHCWCSASFDSYSFFYCLYLLAVVGFCSPLYTMTFSYACLDSLSAPCMLGWLIWLCLACWDIMSGFPGLWLAVSDWYLLGCICCKLNCHWQLFIILHCDGILTLLHLIWHSTSWLVVIYNLYPQWNLNLVASNMA